MAKKVTRCGQQLIVEQVRRTVAERHWDMSPLDGCIYFAGYLTQALWEMNKALGRDRATTAIVEAQFNFAPNTTMPAAATLTVKATNTLYGANAAAKAREAFEDRGIL